MNYLVTYNENGTSKAFYTEWFDSDNNFNAELVMNVFKLLAHQYTTDGKTWVDIEFDHL